MDSHTLYIDKAPTYLATGSFLTLLVVFIFISIGVRESNASLFFIASVIALFGGMITVIVTDDVLHRSWCVEDYITPFIKDFKVKCVDIGKSLLYYISFKQVSVLSEDSDSLYDQCEVNNWKERIGK